MSRQPGDDVPFEVIAMVQNSLSARMAGPQWTFAAGVYGRPGVGAACLELQDRRNVDVNVLLITAYGWAVLERDLGRSEIANLDAHIRDWRERVVLPLRAVRRHLKPLELAQRFRGKVKALELESEQFELAFLAKRLSGMGRAAMADEMAERASLAGTLVDVVAFYSPDAIDQADREAIDVISRAVTVYVEQRPAAD